MPNKNCVQGTNEMQLLRAGQHEKSKKRTLLLTLSPLSQTSPKPMGFERMFLKVPFCNLLESQSIYFHQF